MDNLDQELKNLRSRRDSGEKFDSILLAHYLALESLVMKTKQEVTITDIAKNVKQGQYFRAYAAAWTVAPFETCAATMTAVAPVWCWYGWYFVPWRHKRWPYSEDQWLWRNKIGNKLTTRTFALGFAFVWGADKIFTFMNNSAKNKD